MEQVKKKVARKRCRNEDMRAKAAVARMRGEIFICSDSLHCFQYVFNPALAGAIVESAASAPAAYVTTL